MSFIRRGDRVGLRHSGEEYSGRVGTVKRVRGRFVTVALPEKTYGLLFPKPAVTVTVTDDKCVRFG